ncbi:MAG: PilZ domain-containing protein [Fibrobacterota bacterium]
MTVFRAFAAFFLLPALLAAEEDYSVLNLPRSGSTQILLFIGILVALVVFALLFEKMRKKKTTAEADSALRKSFEQRARNTGLTDAEAERLWKMARQSRKPADAQMVFDVVSVFEHCVERSVSPLILAPGSHDERLDTEALIASIRRKLKFSRIDNDHALESTRNIGVGQAVAVFSSRSALPVIRQARVVANFEFYLRLQYDPAKENPVRIMRGDKVRLSFTRQGDGAYEIDMTVAVADAAGWLELHHTLQFERRQLRRDVRIDAAFPIKFRLVRTPDPSEKERLGATPQNARVADISGGGLSFTADNPLTAQDVLSLSFQLPDNVLSGIQGKVLRISETQNKEKDRALYRHHMQYTHIDSAQKEKIVKYVFDRMRKNNQWR